MQVFGCAWKINFPEMLFSWPCVLVGLTRKWFEVKIFTSNHFRTHAQREKERSHPDHAMNPEPFDFAPFDFANSNFELHQIASFNFTGEPKAQITPSTSLRSHPKIALRQHRSHWDRNWEMVGFWWIWPNLMNFFWLGFVSVFIYWEMVLYICLEAEKMWGTRRKCVFYISFSNTTKH